MIREKNYHLLLARHRAGLTQEELAHKAGTKRKWVSLIETGRGNPSRDLAERLAAALGMRADDLFPDLKTKKRKK